MLPAVRAEQPDLVIVLAHAGGFCDQGGWAWWTSSPARDGKREVRSQIETVWVDAVRPDSGLARLVDTYRRLPREIEDRPVVSMKFPASRNRGEEFGLGRLVADGVRNAGRADVAIMNSGGIRADLPQGSVTYGRFYHVQPFGNEIVKLTLSRDSLKAALEHIFAAGEVRAHVSGLELWYDPTRAPGRRVRQVRLAGGRELKRNETYTLAVPDFLAAGGDGFTMLKGLPIKRTAISDIDALVTYLRRLRQPVEAPRSPRFHRER